VDESAAGLRLDVFLALHTDYTRSRVRRHIDAGAVEVNGSRPKPSRVLRGGETVVYHAVAPEPDEAIPEEIPVPILYEDEHIVVVDKPAGMVVHPAAGHTSGTLVNALLHHCGSLATVGDRLRPGIVHRLDKGTSGVMVVTKSDRAHLSLAEQFSHHRIERSYIALTVGAPPSEAGTFDTFHARHPTRRMRYTSRVGSGRRAVTRYRVLEEIGGMCLVQAILETGRTHQVRVHFAEHGAPLLGDPLYGRPPRDPLLRELGRTLGRQALHAAVLGFVHPISSTPSRFESPLPRDMEEALARARSAAACQCKVPE